MNDAWNSDDIDQAKVELVAAGWEPKTPTLWKHPKGSLHVGPAGAWRVMKREQNDEAHQLTRPKSSWELRAQKAERERDMLRTALVGLVGVDGKDDLGQMEGVMRLMPGPAQDKAVTIDAIHALISTLAE